MVKLTEQQKALYNDLSMAEKIAILLIQLGEEPTALIFSHMEIETITEISRYIATSKSIDRQIAAAVLEEFYALMQSNQYMKTGGIEYAKEILYKTFGPEIAQKILDKLSKSMESTKSFSYLEKIKPQQIADFITKEHPQTIALILAHMDVTSAAETLNYFDDELRGEVVLRMANLGDISPSVIKRVSTVLESKLASLTSYKVEVGGPRAVAEVLNRLGQKASKTTIEKIEQADTELASTIKDLMFTFEDITNLNANAIREILKVVDKKILMIGLKGSGEALKEKFLQNMSQRASEAFLEEMGFLGAVRLKDVEEAQRKVVEQVQVLASQGVFQIGEQDEMIE
ncbi:flagellar motor switch protein G [Campylobacter sputorum subsp. bubulus]|uniref:Flagellar motor switch protein FliG n=1 Tax=Campylobacter sputorum subsp. sputorum TaxID=32024 RepID=A0A381DIN5_9BACT|nr:flagellar motor switch protein FliG [Campylobacter sputorum]ASM35595.1 flagellar motor switch protein [Campylobacter sputorum aubsp. sputorum RM3237]KAB0582673.1 flagellar motor switch protein FliG [Campylobacter sputorum subsp. sputorum]QEL05786.1 flagellar motor switch C-ring protein FliG [Campylobacter sputorum subsp. sputorum]SUX08081.1 flagellar motor switch protein G [Campylobacter sputorum subsp. bubulus]SUX10563.1 flagellar motor switch protein G [Campylobacter sputorum subsp. sputo